jgi:hypothetical protein
MALDLQELQDIAKNVIHSEYKYKLIRFIDSGGGPYIAKAETGKSEPVVYKKWRVDAVGFIVTTGGVSTENPVVYFGTSLGDLGAASNRYGTVTQDVNANKEFDGSDVWIKDPKGLLVAPDALGGGGTHVWDAGLGKLGVWETKATILQIQRPNDHNLTIIPFMLLEVQIK